MGIRETINEKRAISLTVAIGILVVAFFYLTWQTIGSSKGGTLKAFYTVDDGVTWFADDADKIPPFDHNGKQAVMCFVYKCGDDGEPWVSHLMRYTPQGKKQREDQLQNKPDNLVGPNIGQFQQIEVKQARSGDDGWVRINDPRAALIQELKCPDASQDHIIPMDPNS
jgi:hypothetical protein